MFAAVLMVECILGITGFFAGFREPVVLGGLALYEIFDRRITKHWFALATGVDTGHSARSAVDGYPCTVSPRIHRGGCVRHVTVGSIARGVRTQFGVFWDGLETMLTSTDKLVDRLWAVYYPSLALERVPSMLPHTNGSFITGAMLHAVTPRVLFPGKEALQSDSEKVRKYSGISVAGADQNTSIAFGYAAESYIDFGYPFMFVPIFVFGLALGCAYRWFRRLIWHHELFVAFATITFWLSIYLFERSWATMLGASVSMMVYLGLPVILLDRTLLVRFERQQRDAQGLLYDAH